MGTDQGTSRKKTKFNLHFDIDLCDLNLEVKKTIHPFLEHRLKIFTVSNTTLKPGIEKIIPTNLICHQKSIQKQFHIHLKSSQKLPIRLISEQIEVVDKRLFVRVHNYNNFPVKILCKSPIAYLFIQPKTNDDIRT